MRVLHVIDSLGAGGAERSLAELLPHLSANGIDSVVACLVRRDEGVERSLAELGVKVRYLGSTGRVARVRELRAMIAEERPDLVHTAIFESDIAGRLAAWRRVPVISSLVNTAYAPVRFSDPNVRRWRLRAARWIDGITARHMTTWFHALTRAVKDSSVRDLRIPARKVTVIERGRDGGRLGTRSADRRARARRDLGIPDDQKVLVTLGRHEFQKGQIRLLDAIPTVIEAHPDTTLLIGGRTGNSTPQLEARKAALGLGDRVRFLGYREDAPELLAAADVFVFPSLYEGLGGAVIEAMALGLPIVASDLPALREVVEEGGNALLVRPGDASELAAAVNRVLGDGDLRRRFGERSRAIFEERFTIDRSAERMVDLYRGVLGPPETTRTMGSTEPLRSTPAGTSPRPADPTA